MLNKLLLIYFLLSNFIINAQFKLSFEIKDGGINKIIGNSNGKIILVCTSSRSSFQINGASRSYSFNSQNGNGQKELFLLEIDSAFLINNSFHFFGNESIDYAAIINGDNQEIYIKTLDGGDSVLCENKLFVNNSIRNKRKHIRIFNIDLTNDNVSLIKTITTKDSELQLLDFNNNSVWTFINFSDSAFVDGKTFSPINNSSHEYDILGLKLDKLEYKIINEYNLKGKDDQIPIQLGADKYQNTYLTAYSLSTQISYKDSIIWDKNKSIGPFILMKYLENGKLSWLKTSTSPLYKSYIDSDLNVYLNGRYYNSMKLDSFEFINFNNHYSEYIIKLDSNGKAIDFWTLKGTGDNYIYSYLIDEFQNKLVLGGFKDSIYESLNKRIASKGDNDLFIHLLDKDGNVKWSKYFFGDSTEVLVDIVKLDNGNYQLAGYTFSDTLRVGNDTLFNPRNSQKYFIYEFEDPLKTVSSYHKDEDNSLKLYPNPCNDYFELSFPCNYVGGLKMKIISLDGKVVKEQKLFSNSNLIELMMLQSGVFYIIVTKDNNKIIGIRKLVKI